MLRVGKVYFHIDCFKCHGRWNIICLFGGEHGLCQNARHRWLKEASLVSRSTITPTTTALNATNSHSGPNVQLAISLSKAKWSLLWEIPTIKTVFTVIVASRLSICNEVQAVLTMLECLADNRFPVATRLPGREKSVYAPSASRYHLFQRKTMRASSLVG